MDDEFMYTICEWLDKWVPWLSVGVILIIFVLGSSGCLGGFAPTEIVKHPDAPMLINEARGDYVRVSLYSRACNCMVEYGWVEMDERLHGWTLTKTNWEAFIEGER